MPTLKKVIVGIGEALFDLFPDEARLGGAPLNMALHAHQLGDEGVVVSRIGQDELGDRLLAELRRRGMDPSHIQTDPDRPTGTVIVDFDPAGQPTYDITPDAAWDALQWDYDMEDLTQRAAAVCFGTLAQRDGQTRNTIYRFVESCRRAERLLDVNLRGNDHDRRILTRGLEIATAAKLNRDELTILKPLLNLEGAADDAAESLRKTFNLRWVALTRGPDGTAVYTASGMVEAAPAPLTGEGNPVGAGDATAAALLHGVVRRWDWPRTLELANRIGAFVASQPGACPELPADLQVLAGAESA